MEKSFLTIWIFIITALLAGCNDEKEYVIDKSIYANYSSLDLYYGDKVQVTASPVNSSFEWLSEDPAIATVNNTGEVEAVGVGETVIVLTSGEGKVEIPVTVTIPTVDGITARPGKERAQIEVEVLNNLIKTIRIIRMDNGEFMDVDVNFKTGTFTTYYENLAEDSYSFRIISIDQFGMESEPTNVNIRVYGATYQSQISPRDIAVTTAFGNGLAVAWGNAGDNFVDLTYTTIEGEQKNQRIDIGAQYTYILDYLPVTEFSYTTGYLPEPAAVDTFYTEIHTVSIEDIGNKLYTLTSSAESIIAAADFDLGGEGIGFHDTDDENSAGNYGYRENLGDYNSRGCDVEGGGQLGYTNPGEWVMYTVYVEDPGVYTIDFAVSVNESSGTCYVEVDGTPSASYEMESNGSWGDFRYYCEHNSINPPTYNLTKGFHKIKFFFETGGFNYNGLKVVYKSAD